MTHLCRQNLQIYTLHDSHGAWYAIFPGHDTPAEPAIQDGDDVQQEKSKTKLAETALSVAVVTWRHDLPGSMIIGG